MYFAERNTVINRRRHNIKTRVVDIFKKLEQLVAAFSVYSDIKRLVLFLQANEEPFAAHIQMNVKLP